MSVLLANHPAFRRFAELTQTSYRVFFTNQKELDLWLRARNWTAVQADRRDPGSVLEWSHSNSGKYIKLTHKIFESDGRLRIYTEQDWSDEWLQIAVDPVPEPSDEDIPF